VSIFITFPEKTILLSLKLSSTDIGKHLQVGLKESCAKFKRANSIRFILKNGA
jgi:hypothetical protein